MSFNAYRSFPVTAYLLITLVGTIVLATFYYLAVYGILPILRRKRYVLGITYLIIGLICYTVLDSYLEILFIDTCEECQGMLSHENAAYAAYLERGLINVILTRLLGLGTPIFLLFALCIPFSIKMTIQAFRSNIQALQLAKDNLQLEFNFLKAQLNPHFLFNAMNNIYGLILSGDREKSARLVSRLSELLRYTLYDSNEDQMPIERELKLMKDYIELEKVRLNDTKVNFKWQLDHNDYHIAPLLLIPLIDNAFKYNSDEEGSYIDIFLDVLQGRFRFTIENSISEGTKGQVVGGIGINNLKKRLELYYKNNHWYETSVLDGVYSVNLIIQL
ncbi:histidine kinase [Pedobacter sp. Du54]|uniref:sensor histidine kinase n=1 Tax=Pedobacter anseongensis TaxID=3133439 RepID=UPI0030979D83